MARLLCINSNLRREGASIYALAWLLLIGSSASCVMVPGVTIFGTAHLVCEHQSGHPPALCLGSERCKPAAHTQLTAEKMDSTEKQLIKTTSTKFRLHFFYHLIVGTVQLVCHWFGVCDFFIASRDIIWYAAGLQNIIPAVDLC